MKKFSLFIRICVSCCLVSTFLVSGCSTLTNKSASKAEAFPSKPVNIVIERVDAKTGEVITTPAPADTVIVEKPTIETPSVETLPVETIVESDSYVAQTQTIEQVTDGVVSWDALRVPGSEYETVSSSETTQGIPTVPDNIDVTTVDAPTYADPIETTETLIQDTAYSNYGNGIWSRIQNGYAFPQIEHPLIDRYVAWNQTHADYVSQMLVRSQPFLFYIVEQIEARGMPMEIALLPAIESAFKVRAYSRSRASGLWQFIPSTGKHFGMRQDWWVDQRRDIVIATNTALDYLLDINQQFNGDWLLTLASYNGGRGTISRAVRKNQRAGLNTDYFSLNLRRETAHYVPKLIALSRVVLNPSAYGVQLPAIDNTPYFEELKLKGQTDLIQLVNNTTIDRKKFDRLNPQFLRWASDPRGPHRVLVPLTDSVSVSNYISSLDDQKKIRWRKHYLVSGDTLSGLARRYRVSASAIRSINGMRSNNLRAGKTILIPVRNTTTAQASITKPRVIQAAPTQVVISQPALIQPNLIQQQSAEPVNQTSSPSHHIVSSGDTLWSISRLYNVSVDDLLVLNKLSYNSTLALNQQIQLKSN